MKFAEMSLAEIFDEPKKQNFYQQTERIGTDLYLALGYFNDHAIDDDYSQGLRNMTIAVYYTGICSFIQIEHGLVFSAVCNLEYSHAVLLRSYLDIIGRTHKAARIYKRYLETQNAEVFRKTSERLIMPYSKEGRGEGGFGIFSLVDGLEDKIPNIRAIYGELSEYLHGSSVLMHGTYRKDSYLRLKKGEPSSTIIRHKEIVDKLRDIFLEDIVLMQELTAHLKERQI
jgi:hypothetical protein